MGLEVRNVTGGYFKEVDVLHGVSIEAESGKVTCIIGPNGAGKSTLLKTIVGLLSCKSGNIAYDGNDITNLQPDQIVAKGISFVPQRRSVFPGLTVDDNLRLACWKFRRQRQKVEELIKSTYDSYPMLKLKKSQHANYLSGGQQRLLELVRALIQSPKLIVFDEPSEGLDPITTAAIYDEITKLRNGNMTVLLVDQNVKKAVEVSDYVYSMEFGKNGIKGTAEEVGKSLREIISSWLLA